MSRALRGGLVALLLAAACDSSPSSNDGSAVADGAVGGDDGGAPGIDGGTSCPSGGPPPGAAATLAFAYPNGFASAMSAIQTTTDASQFMGDLIALANGLLGPHEAGSAWYETQQDIQSFTTDFTFEMLTPGPGAPIQGVTFCVQNTNSTTNPNSSGDHVAADANGIGYAAYQPNSGQYPIYDSIAVKFDMSGFGQHNYVTNANATGLYIDGGPSIETSTGLIPEVDLNPAGIDLHAGHVMAGHIVYDGSVLVLVLQDTVTSTQARYSWPIDIPTAVGGNMAWVGFTAGEIPANANNLLSWDFYEGMNPRLAAPVFSVDAGAYQSAQTVSLCATEGATIYYTTNGQAPTTSSTPYTGPITVGASEVVEAIAVQTGYTDSLVAVANYQIAPAGTPLVDFPAGFASSSSLVALNGAAQPSGAAIQLTDTASSGEASSAWYVAPVSVASFHTAFTIQISSPGQFANGFTFAIQNQNPTSTDGTSLYVSGGPNAIGSNASGLGYQGLLDSVAVAFDLYDGSGDLVGLYTNGAVPTGSSIDMTSSGVSLHGGNPLDVVLDYDGTTLTLTVTDTVSNATFSHGFPIDIPSTVGGQTAYVGFTAATGGQSALQKLSSWTYTN